MRDCRKKGKAKEKGGDGGNGYAKGGTFVDGDSPTSMRKMQTAEKAENNDGKTAYERPYGNSAKVQGMSFAEGILW